MKLDDWYVDLLNRRSAKLPTRLTVEGIRNAHLGPRWEFARIVVEAEPSESFRVNYAIEIKSEHAEWLRAALCGILDILLTAEPLPVRDVSLRIVEFEVHETDSSEFAFRQAGRDAGRKLLGAMISEPAVFSDC